jgi:preprotein translocase subunit SecB
MTDQNVAQQTPPLFNIEKLYVKDLSLEIPHSPGIYLERAQPQVDLQLSSQAAVVEDGVYEVTVTVTVTAKIAEKDIVAFLIETKQAGVFVVRNMPPEELEQVLAIVGPDVLYPFLREVVSDMSVRAGFNAVLLNPVNFEAIYEQQKEQQRAGAIPVTA